MTEGLKISSSVHRVLGNERIKEICRKHGLTVEDEKNIDEILERWENLVGQTIQKMAVIEEIIGDNPRISQITKAMLEITLEFATKSWQGNVSFKAV